MGRREGRLWEDGFGRVLEVLNTDRREEKKKLSLLARTHSLADGSWDSLFLPNSS